MNKRIYLSPPHISGDEKKLLLEAFDSNWIAPLGPNVDAFEKEISNYLRSKNAVALSSGTAALHLALVIAGINERDRVLCPSLTFVATANAIKYINAEPIFIDSDPHTWVCSLDALELAIKKYKPKAFVSVDIYGQSCDYDAIQELCNSHNVLVIEDAAEALGSEYKNKKCGSFGEMSILSFNGNKIITTSGGGMLVSKNEDYIRKAKFLCTQAREPFLHYEHKELGYNYRMSNLLAAVGRGQLAKLDVYVAKRRKIFQEYQKAFSDIPGVNFITEPTSSKSNNWLTTFTINPKKSTSNRNQLIKMLSKENIESRPVWKPMHLQPLYKNNKYVNIDNNDISAELFDRGLCLPSGSSLSVKDQNRVIDIVLSCFR